MATRYYLKDVSDFILTQAQDATKGINALISTINTERSLTGTDACPDVKTFTKFWSRKNALPELFVDFQGSEILNDEDTLGGGGDTIGSSLGTRFPDKTPEIYSVNIFIRHKSNYNQLTDYMEIFAEAIYRTFHMYSDSNISSMLATASIIDNINTEENQTEKVSGFSFDIRIGD